MLIIICRAVREAGYVADGAVGKKESRKVGS